MRSLRSVVLVVAALAFCLSIAAASFGESIGYVDVSRVFKDYKEAEKAQENLKKESDAFYVEVKAAQEQLDKAEKEKKSQEDLDKLNKELTEKLEPKKQALLKLNDELTSRLQADIMASIKRVSKKVGIDVVLSKSIDMAIGNQKTSEPVILIGGVDLTEMVISDLNKK